MSTPTVLPADLLQKSVGELAALPVQVHFEIERNLTEASTFLKKMRTKFDAALEARYGEAARSALRASGRDFGTTHLTEGGLQISYTLPKRIVWDQSQLAERAEHLVAHGERVTDYLDLSLSVSETRYNAWPPVLREQFAPARTVKAGKASFEFTLNRDEGGV